MKNRRERGQLYMLTIDVAQLVINKNCIKRVLLLKNSATRKSFKTLNDMIIGTAGT